MVMNKTFSAILPQQAYDAKQVQANEAQIADKHNIAMFELMNMAGQAVFDLYQHHYPSTHALLVLCGKGNNGGDGFITAQLAIAQGINVTVIMLCHSDDLKGDALKAYQQLCASPYASEKLELVALVSDKAATNVSEQVAKVLAHTIDQLTARSENESALGGNIVIIDALLGTGFYGSLTEPYFLLCDAVNQQVTNCRTPIKVISIDVPSGVNATTGEVALHAIRAHHTISFIALKKGLITGNATSHTGELVYADLTIGESFHTAISPTAHRLTFDNIPQLNARTINSHKGTIGQLLLIGGNKRFPGAIKMSAEAALRSGAALVSVCCHKDNRTILLNNRPEIMLAPDNAEVLFSTYDNSKTKALIIGPGLGQGRWAQALFNGAINFIQQRKLPAVIDADALTLLAKSPSLYQHWVLTPHPGEAAKLLNCSIEEVEKNRFAAVQAIQQKYGGICLLKGAGTLITNGESLSINTTGNPGMASGGMGDVLSGIIGALLLQSNTQLQATQLAAFIHGLAADKIAQQQGMIGMLASDIIERLPALLNQYAFNKS